MAKTTSCFMSMLFLAAPSVLWAQDLPAAKAADVEPEAKPEAAAEAAAPAANDTQKKQDIRRLLFITGSQDVGEQVINQMLPSYQQGMPKVPKKFWSQFRKTVRTDEIVDRVVAVYNEHFSHQEVKDLLAFYETDTGKRFLQIMPHVSQEAMAVGQQWALEIVARLEKRLQDKGHAPKP